MVLAPLVGLALTFQKARRLAFPAEYRSAYEYDSHLLGGPAGVAELLRRFESGGLVERGLAAQTLLDSASSGLVVSLTSISSSVSAAREPARVRLGSSCRRS